MQTSFESPVDQPLIPQLMFQLFYLEFNNIGGEGCMHMSKAQWTNLQKLKLCINYTI